MKKTILFSLAVLVLSTFCTAQDEYLDKVQTLDSTIETLYAVISGEAGEKRDWDLFKYLFTADARLIPSGPNQEGKISYQVMSPDQYIDSSGAWLEENGFFEKEIYRITESFGSLTHIFSTYESYRSESDEKPFTRGINSIQLMKDSNRWWIVNIYWTGERADNPIPEKYLPKK
ncbi:hypothetical protein [Ekhidna sp.]|jgi:hypothetical protein|uniref:hypothetical protein n=1 Tax=Ekhidna sp. TaxID=2608089 RepID=UPI0032EC254B